MIYIVMKFQTPGFNTLADMNVFLVNCDANKHADENVFHSEVGYFL